jgi:predicted nucleic acid-binding protein
LTTFVLDAGVAAKWFLPAPAEDLVPEAFQLLRQYELGELDFVVPDLFWAEFGNLAWNAARRGRWPTTDAMTAVREILSRQFLTFSSRELLNPAFEIAGRFDRTVYDSLYVALAVELHTDLITADERLVNALAARFPVKWLGSFSVS